MAARFAAIAIGVAAAIACASACSLSGLDDKYGLSEGGAEASGADACAPTENCTNGVDDDCNGLVDCADPACTSSGFTCTAADVPAGWSLVLYSASARPVCPPGFGAEQSIVSNVSGAPVTCACECTGGPATCGGTARYDAYPNACATGATAVTLNVNNGACTPVTTSVVSGDYYQLYFDDVPTPKQGMCTGTGKITASPMPAFSAGATCASPPSLGAGCSAGVCAPPASSPWKTCIARAGDQACPSFGFTSKSLVSSGSPGFVDQRTCGACPCATSLGCGTVTNVAVFTNANCNGGAAHSFDPTCQLASANESIGSYKFAFPTTGDAACKPTGASAPGGTVALDASAETICCAP